MQLHRPLLSGLRISLYAEKITKGIPYEDAVISSEIHQTISDFDTGAWKAWMLHTVYSKDTLKK